MNINIAKLLFAAFFVLPLLSGQASARVKCESFDGWKHCSCLKGCTASKTSCYCGNKPRVNAGTYTGGFKVKPLPMSKIPKLRAGNQKNKK